MDNCILVDSLCLMNLGLNCSYLAIGKFLVWAEGGLEFNDVNSIKKKKKKKPLVYLPPRREGKKKKKKKHLGNSRAFSITRHI